MKVTASDRRLPRRQALPAHRPGRLPAAPPEDCQGQARRQDAGRVRRQLRHRRRLSPRWRGSSARTVFAFSRSQTGTHVENADDVQAALQQAYDATGRIDFVVNTAGVLPTGDLADGPRGDDRAATRGQLPGAGDRSPRRRSATSLPRRATCSCSRRAPTPAAGPATASTPRRRPPSSTSPRRSPTSGPDSASGSTASTPSAPSTPMRYAPSARSRPTPCCRPCRWRSPRSTCSCPT